MEKHKKKLIILGVVVLVILSTIFYRTQSKPSIPSNTTPHSMIDEPCVWVDIKGAVYKPNIYCVKKDSMLEEIIILAGGFHYNADLSSINRVSKISTETMIMIPFVKETEVGKISINQATIDELMKIPHIGESKAKAIVDYRNKSGRFTKLDDITKVSGIGNETYLKIKDYISL